MVTYYDVWHSWRLGTRPTWGEQEVHMLEADIQRSVNKTPSPMLSDGKEVQEVSLARKSDHSSSHLIVSVTSWSESIRWKSPEINSL